MPPQCSAKQLRRSAPLHSRSTPPRRRAPLCVWQDQIVELVALPAAVAGAVPGRAAARGCQPLWPSKL
eukprot:159039-Alexandrium_andersonii.AAC.1